MTWIKTSYWLFWTVFELPQTYYKKAVQIRFNKDRWQWRRDDSNWAGGGWSDWDFLRYGEDSIQDELMSKALAEKLQQ